MEDVEPFLSLAREAFGNEPDAVNLWIGDERSLSAVHKDHYEVRLALSGIGRQRVKKQEVRGVLSRATRCPVLALSCGL